MGRADSHRLLAGVAAVANDRIREHAVRLIGEHVDIGALALAFTDSDAASAEMLVAGSDFYPRMLADIASATSSIHINQFGFRSGAAGDEFAEVLVKKASDGVPVRLIVDLRGSDPERASRHLYDRLSAAGVEICVVRALKPRTRVGPIGGGGSARWNVDGLGHFDHRKLTIVDGRIGWVGGAGIEDHFADGRFHDQFIRFTGPVVNQLALVFVASFRWLGGTIPASQIDAIIPTLEAGADAVPAIVLHNAPGPYRPITAAIAEMLDGATETLDIANPYVTDRRMIGKIANAARRGVSVRLFVPASANNWACAAAQHAHHATLLDAGVRIIEHPRMLHAKVFVADRQDVLAGTCNLDAWSLKRFLEVDVRIRSADLAFQFEERFAAPAELVSGRRTPADRQARASEGDTVRNDLAGALRRSSMMSENAPGSQVPGEESSLQEPATEPLTESDGPRSTAESSWQSRLRRSRERLSTWPGVASMAIVVTVVGAWAPWSVDGPVRLGGLEASHDGWLAALYALVAIAAVKRLARRTWPAIVVTLICGLAVLLFVLGDAPPPGSDRAWGWWLTLIGGLTIVVAAAATAVVRLRGDSEQRWVTPPFSRRRTALGGLAVAGTLLLLLVFVRVLFVTEHSNWPPPPDAVTAEQAEATTEEFVAGSPRPRDVDIDYAWSSAATVEPWAEGTEFYPRIFDDVRGAESSVHIIMFGWNSGEIGTQLAEILHEKLAEGVEVRILVDDQGSDPDGDSEDMYSALVDAGAQVEANDTIQLDFDGLFVDRELDWRQDEFGRAEHRKLYVIDGVVAWTGGAGVQDHFADGRFHDVMVRVTGDVVRQAQAVFLTSFRAHGAPMPADLGAYFPPQPDAGSLPTALVQVIPGGYVSATQAIRDMIDNAERRVDVMNPYLTDTDIIQRLIAASERGVEVRVVVSETSNNKYAEAALSHHYPALIDAGVEVWEYPGAVVHAKVLVADDQVNFGTVNLDAWALYRDFELGMIVEDPATVDLFETRLFEPDIARSRRAEPPSGLIDRASAWMWDKFGYFL